MASQTTNPEIKASLLFILVALLLSGGCTRLGIAANSGDNPGETCLHEDSGTKSFVNEAHGYCLLYPNNYDLGEPNEHEIALFVSSLLDVEHPKIFIDVQAANGRTAGQVADEIESGYPGFDIQRIDNLVIDGVTSVVLDGVPGQDSSRQVVLIHNDLVYHMTFFPTDASYGEIYTQMKQAYKTITRSFRFLP